MKILMTNIATQLKTLTLLAIILLTSVKVSAATVIIDDSGKLSGATDVIVNGLSYNVTLADSSCEQLFFGCNESSDFVFQTIETATAASQALLDQVLIDFAAPDSFDSNPEKMFGCTNSGLCRALTVYALTTTSGTIAGVTADNNAVNANDIVTLNIGIGSQTNLADVSIATYAVWVANPVPVPPSLPLFMFAFAGLMLSKYHKQH